MSELPKLSKPNARSLENIKKIEAMIGKRLQQIPIEKIMYYDSRCGYSCDEAGDVTGLNLDECQLSDISFLTDFPRLTHLSLDRNKIADLSPLKALPKLEYLFIDNNPIEIPPPEIAEQGIEPTTRGVDIIPWELPCTFQDDKTQPVKLYFWDFGGQGAFL